MHKIITSIVLLLCIIFLIVYAVYLEDLVRMKMNRIYSYFGGEDPPEFPIFITRIICIVIAIIFSIALIYYIFQ